MEAAIKAQEGESDRLKETMAITEMLKRQSEGSKETPMTEDPLFQDRLFEERMITLSELERYSPIIRASLADELKAAEDTATGFIEKEKAKQAVLSETPAMMKKAHQMQLAATGQFFGAMAGLAATGGDKMFNISKGFRVAEAIIAGVQATQEALAAPPGPPWSIPLAALVAATAAANVATIIATKPGGGGSIGSPSLGGGGGSPGTSSAIEVPEVPSGGGMNVNISVAGFVGDESTLASELGRVFREATGDGVGFGLETSRR